MPCAGAPIQILLQLSAVPSSQDGELALTSRGWALYVCLLVVHTTSLDKVPHRHCMSVKGLGLQEKGVCSRASSPVWPACASAAATIGTALAGRLRCASTCTWPGLNIRHIPAAHPVSKSRTRALWLCSMHAGYWFLHLCSAASASPASEGPPCPRVHPLPASHPEPSVTMQPPLCHLQAPLAAHPSDLEHEHGCLLLNACIRPWRPTVVSFVLRTQS